MVMSRSFSSGGEKAEEVLRIHIAGRWATDDFSQFFTEFGTLNEMAHFGQVRVDGQSSVSLWRIVRGARPIYSPYWSDPELELTIQTEVEETRLRHFLREVSAHQPLRVKEIEFASPGFTDLAGVGRVVREIRLFAMDIADRFIARPDRALAREEKHQSIVAKKIANAERILKLSDKIDLDPVTRRELIRRALEIDRYVETQIIDGKITSFDEE
jgi:hypothetical protein